jgi:hypothetical protein
MPPYGYPPMMAPPRRTDSSKASFAGILCILGAIASLLITAVVFLLASFIGSLGLVLPFSGLLGTSVAVILGVGVLSAAGGIMGAVFSFKRQNWGLAILGAIILLVTGRFITGLIAVILLAVAREDFES